MKDRLGIRDEIDKIRGYKLASLPNITMMMDLKRTMTNEHEINHGTNFQ